MTMNTATLSLKQNGLRGQIEMEVGKVDDPASPSAQILTPLAVAFSTLVGEHEPLKPEDGEEETAFTATLSFTHDTERDMCSLNAEFEPSIEQYTNLYDMPDSYQMMQLVVTQFLEGVGALTKEGEVDDAFIEPAKPALLN